MMEQYIHQDAYDEVVDLICDLADKVGRDIYPGNNDLDTLHYALRVENATRHINGYKHFED